MSNTAVVFACAITFVMFMLSMIALAVFPKNKLWYFLILPLIVVCVFVVLLFHSFWATPHTYYFVDLTDGEKCVIERLRSENGINWVCHNNIHEKEDMTIDGYIFEVRTFNHDDLKRKFEQLGLNYYGSSGEAYHCVRSGMCSK